jgi:diguanylate cyclase (GGDEF)-like protein
VHLAQDDLRATPAEVVTQAYTQALHSTLGMASATDLAELTTRTLVAARTIADAAVAALISPDGELRAEGDVDLAERLGGADRGLRERLCAAPAGPTDLLAGFGLRSVVSVPVAGGALLVVNPGRDGTQLLVLVGAHHVAGLDRLSQLDALRRFANSDPLTGLRHHRPFQRRLARATPGHTAVIALDVDGFKSINDEYGHAAGDSALIRLGNALQDALRERDGLYRVGGDEFAVLVEVAGAAEAVAIAERLLRAARAAGHPVSVGVALRRADEDGADTLRRADDALYEAKRAGRDTVRVAT